jgi:hypothetical protein
MRTLSSKKSSIGRRFNDLIGSKTPRRPSSSDSTKGGSVTPPKQTTTPSASSSPQGPQTRTPSSPPTRYTFDEQHRLPVTYLPFVSTETPFIKGLDDVFGESKSSPRSSFEFNESPIDHEDNWFSMSQGSARFNMQDTRTRSSSKGTYESTGKEVTIGWVCEDGFKPIGEFD